MLLPKHVAASTQNKGVLQISAYSWSILLLCDVEYWYPLTVRLETIFICTMRMVRQIQNKSPSNAHVSKARSLISTFPYLFTFLRLKSRVIFY
jgi:hypothetical protein